MLLEAKEYPIGLISDVHCFIKSTAEILAKHPEVKQWYCLGDVVDFLGPQRNTETMDWWEHNMKNVPTVLGNHDQVVAQRMLNINHLHKSIIRKWYDSIDLILPDVNHLMFYHNRPKDLWTFTEPTVTEQEFVDDYPTGDHIKACCIGHNHKQFRKEFQGTNTELWSVGAVKEGHYAIIDENGLHLKQL